MYGYNVKNETTDKWIYSTYLITATTTWTNGYNEHILVNASGDNLLRCKCRKDMDQQ